MGTFKPPKKTVQDTPQPIAEKPTEAAQPLTRNPKEEQLGVFRALVIRMSQAGKTPKEIVDFMYNPSAVTFGEKSSEFNVAVYAGIMNYTTVEERQKILDELAEAQLV